MTRCVVATINSMTSLLETRRAQILSLGTFLTTIIVVTTTLMEPVNAPKMLILSITTFSLMGTLVIGTRKRFEVKKNPIAVLMIFFLLWLWISTLMSNQSFTHSFYGVFGRSTGTLTYTLLPILFLFSLTIRDSRNQLKILNALFYAGWVNLGYFVLTLFGVEIFDWNNPTGRVLGTFGNSNFAGAFMALFSILCVTRALDSSLKRWIRIASLLGLSVALFEVYRSLAVQGYVIFIFGLTVLLFFFLRQKSQTIYQRLFLLGVPSIAILSVMALVNKGPLASLIYKPSITYRGYYWEAAWNVGLANPIFGVGPDSFGIYFRQFRSLASVESVGLNTATDAAHNVYLDILAYGGFPLFALYSLLQVIVLVSILRQIRQSTKIDFQFQALVALWLMYQLQSLVSINQIGLAIWGWVLGGLILARERDFGTSTSLTLIPKLKPANKNGQLLPPSYVLRMVLGFSVGLMLAIPPVFADSNYFQAVKKRDAVLIEKYALAWPTNPIRIGDAASIFLDSGFSEKALELAELGTQQFPDSFTAWKVLEKIPTRSKEQQIQIDKALSVIDPLNPEYRD